MKKVKLSVAELQVLVQKAVTEGIYKSQLVSDEPNAPKEFLNFKEAAAFLDLTESTLYSYTSRKKIPFIKRTRKLIFRKTDLIEWLNSGHIDSLENYKKSIK